MNERITTKETMYRLLYSGRFGNYPRCWNSLESLAASGYGGHVSIRSREISNPVRLYHVPAADIPATIAALPEHHRAAGLMFSESPPDEYRTIQGEYDGRHLHYSFYQAPMRLAFEKQSLYTDGLKAKMLLRHFLDPSDLDWLEELLADFPDHVVEFSGFKVRVGQLRRRAIFWEVRYY